MNINEIPDIINGCPLDFKSDDFINKVKRIIPIEFTVEIILINRKNGTYISLDEFEVIDNEDKLQQALEKYNPMIRMGLFRNTFSFRYFEDIFENNISPVVNKIVKPFNTKVIDIVKREYDLDGEIGLLGYKDIKTDEDRLEFLLKADNIVDNIIKILNNNKFEYVKLLIHTYEDLGFLLNRGYVAKYLRDPDKFIEYEDGSLVGIFESDFATTYIYPDGFERYT